MSGMYPDEQKISIYGKEVSWPGLKDGKFTSGDFNDPLVPPSFIPAETQNLILDNLGNLVASMGGTPDNAMLNQLVALFTVAATAHKGIKRDAVGRAKVAAPAAPDDIARKAEVDAEATARANADGMLQNNINNHTVATNVHGATSAAIASRIMMRDGSGYADFTTAPTSDKSNKAASTQFVVNFIRDYIIPVNKAIYVQYPGMSAPTDYYAGLGITTWTKVFSGGYFFRTEGGNALPFNGGGQDSKNRLHGHTGATTSMNRNSSHQHGGSTGSMNRNASHSHSYVAWNGNEGSNRCISTVYDVGVKNESGKVLPTDTNHEHGFSTDWRDINHEHAFSTSSDGGNEANPINQTYIIWKRTA